MSEFTDAAAAALGALDAEESAARATLVVQADEAVSDHAVSIVQALVTQRLALWVSTLRRRRARRPALLFLRRVARGFRARVILSREWVASASASRRLLGSKKGANRKLSMSSAIAAIRVQRWFRVALAALRRRRRRQWLQKVFDSAKKIQKSWRGYVSRNRARSALRQSVLQSQCRMLINYVCSAARQPWSEAEADLSCDDADGAVSEALQTIDPEADAHWMAQRVAAAARPAARHRALSPRSKSRPRPSPLPPR
jgi:hypothetical protein